MTGFALGFCCACSPALVHPFMSCVICGKKQSIMAQEDKMPSLGCRRKEINPAQAPKCDNYSILFTASFHLSPHELFIRGSTYATAGCSRSRARAGIVALTCGNQILGTNGDDCRCILHQSQRYVVLSNNVKRARGTGSKVCHLQRAGIDSLNCAVWARSRRRRRA